MTADVRVDREFRRLIPTTDGQQLETRARCQDDGHPVGAVHPTWFGYGQPGSYLAEVDSTWPITRCGRGWTKRRAINDLIRHMTKEA